MWLVPLIMEPGFKLNPSFPPNPWIWGMMTWVKGLKKRPWSTHLKWLTLNRPGEMVRKAECQPCPSPPYQNLHFHKILRWITCHLSLRRSGSSVVVLCGPALAFILQHPPFTHTPPTHTQLRWGQARTNGLESMKRSPMFLQLWQIPLASRYFGWSSSNPDLC